MIAKLSLSPNSSFVWYVMLVEDKVLVLRNRGMAPCPYRWMLVFVFMLITNGDKQCYEW